MKKILFLIFLFHSLLMCSQVSSDILNSARGLSDNKESQFDGENSLSLLYETFDVRVSYKKELVTLKAFEIYPDLKKVTKIKRVIFLNNEEKEALAQDFDNTEVKIDVQDLPLGTYNINIKTDNGQVNKQFIKK